MTASEASHRSVTERASATGSSCSTSEPASSLRLTGARVEPNLSGLGTRQREDLIDQLRQPVDLLDLTGERRSLCLARLRRAERELDLAAKHRERRAQLVGQGGAELAHLVDGMFEVAERVVEGDRRLDPVHRPYREPAVG